MKAVFDTPAAKMANPVDRLAYWIHERAMIYHRRTIEKLPKPWTEDQIMLQYKFCNVQREHDRVTQWLRVNWRDPNYADKNAWHAMMLARLINWPETLKAIGYPKTWNKETVRTIMHARQASKEQVFTGAYMVTCGGQSGSKIDYIVNLMDKARSFDNPPVRGDTLQQAHTKLLGAPGMGSFMAAQVVADLKHMRLLLDAPDWWDWAAPGPGSLRGFERVRGQRVTNKAGFCAGLAELRIEIIDKLPMENISLQDLQNCLCEFDKYERTLWGQGRPRSRYPGVQQEEELW